MVKERSIALCIILTLVTCGIYGIIWFITLTDDTNTALGKPGTSGGMAFLLTLITCGINSWYWAYKQGDKLDEAKQAKGIASGNSGIIYLLLCFFGLGIVAYALMQDSLNKLA